MRTIDADYCPSAQIQTDYSTTLNTSMTLQRVLIIGFGDTLSIQQLQLKKEDNNSTFICVANLADLENITSAQTIVHFGE